VEAVPTGRRLSVAHRRAKLTPFGRLLLVQRVTELGWSATEAAKAASVSRATVYKWLRRYREQGEAGLQDRDEILVLRAPFEGGREDGHGVAGLPDTLRALSENRVAQLLVSQGFAAPGWRCDNCQMHCTVGRRCKRCGAEMVELEDVVEEAVQDGLAQSCEVEVCDNADLDVLGRIGALLRF
jgi:transposase-like protein